MANQRDIIKKNRSSLCDLTTCSKRLLDKSVEHGLLTKDDCVEIVGDHPMGYKRNDVFYTVLERKGAGVFGKMVELMGSEGIEESEDVLSILRSGLGQTPPVQQNTIVTTTAASSDSGTLPITGVGSSILTESDVHTIALKMKQDKDLCERHLQLYSALKLRPADTVNMPDDRYTFFTSMLTKWIAKSSKECPPTVGGLVNALISLEMNGVADSILELERKGEFQRQ